ncbi:MAG: phosphate signaling complex PhoU family protein [Acidimicrobiales bacterium]
MVSRDELGEIDRQVVRLFALVSEGLAAATEAFLASDRDTARTVVEGDLRIDALQRSVEDLVQYQLAAHFPPTKEEMGLLISVLRIVPELERSGDLVEHIALRTPQGLARNLSPRARGTVQQMGQVGVAMWRAAADAYVARDPDAGEHLRVLDDQLDDLHVELISELANSLVSVPVAIEMGLVARFLERLGDHAVNVTRRIQFLVQPTIGVAAGGPR